jgi:hypothetical protein
LRRELDRLFLIGVFLSNVYAPLNAAEFGGNVNGPSYRKPLIDSSTLKRQRLCAVKGSLLNVERCLLNVAISAFASAVAALSARLGVVYGSLRAIQK